MYVINRTPYNEKLLEPSLWHHAITLFFLSRQVSAIEITRNFSYSCSLTKLLDMAIEISGCVVSRKIYKERHFAPKVSLFHHHHQITRKKKRKQYGTLKPLIQRRFT
jgi:hypothetical protein